jgi:hypothetical protein
MLLHAFGRLVLQLVLDVERGKQEGLARSFLCLFFLLCCLLAAAVDMRLSAGAAAEGL